MGEEFLYEKVKTADSFETLVIIYQAMWHSILDTTVCPKSHSAGGADNYLCGEEVCFVSSGAISAL
jgi:hypothetical protein